MPSSSRNRPSELLNLGRDAPSSLIRGGVGTYRRQPKNSLAERKIRAVGGNLWAEASVTSLADPNAATDLGVFSGADPDAKQGK